MKGDAAIALMTLRLSSPTRYGSGRKTSINKNNRRVNFARPNFAQEGGF
jgi:hypothetical protein